MQLLFMRQPQALHQRADTAKAMRTGLVSLPWFGRIEYFQAQVGPPLATNSGEDFVVLLTGAPITAVLMTAERMRASEAHTMMTAQNQNFYLISSFSVVEHVPGIDWHAAVTAADAALYEAKSFGRNRVVVGRI